jgi:hypothetical protein
VLGRVTAGIVTGACRTGRSPANVTRKEKQEVTGLPSSVAGLYFPDPAFAIRRAPSSSRALPELVSIVGSSVSLPSMLTHTRTTALGQASSRHRFTNSPGGVAHAASVSKDIAATERRPGERSRFNTICLGSTLTLSSPGGLFSSKQAVHYILCSVAAGDEHAVGNERVAVPPDFMSMRARATHAPGPVPQDHGEHYREIPGLAAHAGNNASSPVRSG